jgi:hypothetical protein
VGIGRGFTYTEIKRVHDTGGNIEAIVKPEGLKKLLNAFDKLDIKMDVCAVYLTIDIDTQIKRYVTRAGYKHYGDLPRFNIDPKSKKPNQASQQDLQNRIKNNAIELAEAKELDVYTFIDASKTITFDKKGASR